MPGSLRGFRMAGALAAMAAACSGRAGVGTTANTGGISLAVSVPSVVVEAGGSTNIVALVTRSGGFSGDPAVALDDGPGGVTATMADATTHGNVTTATVTVVVAASVAPGQYTVTLRGTGTGVAKTTATFQLVVVPHPAETFTVQLSAPTLEVVQGQSDSSLQVVLARNGFSSGVKLTLDSPPAGVTVKFADSLATAETTQLTLSVAPTVEPGTYTLIVRGTAPGMSDRTATLVLTISAAGSYRLGATPAAVTLQQGASMFPVIAITRSNYGESIALLAEQVPTGLSAAITPAATTGTAATLSIGAADQLPVGVDTIVIRGVGAGLPDQVLAFVVKVVPPSPSAITVVSGNGQSGMADDPLADSIRVRVADQAGRPLAGVSVSFAVASGEGSIAVPTATTDTTGTASTAWILGPDLGNQQLTASAAGISANAVATAAGCDPVSCAASLSMDNPQWTPFTLSTYEGSGQVVHPDIASGGPGRWRWLAITPYPGGDATYENPSVYQSRNGHAWRAPAGLANPVEQPNGSGYFSDPDVSVDTATNTLWLYYRQVYVSSNIIWLTRSADGTHWSAPVQVLNVPSHGAVSPTVVRGAPKAPWIMWVVNAGPNGCQATSSTVERRVSLDGVNWDAPGTTDLAEPGRVIWHIDVEWVAPRNEFWAIYNSYASGLSCSTDALHFARSADGMHWQTYPAPIVTAGVIPEFHDIVYRSTFLPSAAGDTIRIWASGARMVQNSYIWSAAHATFRVDDLLSGLQAGIRAPIDLKSRIGLPMPEPHDSGVHGERRP